MESMNHAGKCPHGRIIGCLATIYILLPLRKFVNYVSQSPRTQFPSGLRMAFKECDSIRVEVRWIG